MGSVGRYIKNRLPNPLVKRAAYFYGSDRINIDYFTGSGLNIELDIEERWEIYIHHLKGRPWALAEVDFAPPKYVFGRRSRKECTAEAEVKAVAKVFVDCVKRSCALGYDPFEIVPEPERTLQAAVHRRIAELKHWVPSGLKGDLGDHYPRLRDPELLAEFERRVMVEVMQG